MAPLDGAEAQRELQKGHEDTTERRTSTRAVPQTRSSPLGQENRTRNQRRPRVNKLSRSKKRIFEFDLSNPEWEESDSSPQVKRSKLVVANVDSIDSVKDKENIMAYSHHPHPMGHGGMTMGHHTMSSGNSSKLLHGGGSSHHNDHVGSSSSLGNNHHNNSSKYSSASLNTASSSASVASKAPAIAALCNLGNTCFLNSVLYTLRFTPGFIHNLHHMVHDLNLENGGNGRASSSAGPTFSVGSKTAKRGAVGNGFASNGHSSSNASSINEVNSGVDSDEGMSHEVIGELHDLFRKLSLADNGSDSKDPIPPSLFLKSVGKLNPMFEGNHQQDAHELLVMILNILEDIKITAPPPSSIAIDGGAGGDGFRSESNLSSPQSVVDGRPSVTLDKKRAKKKKEPLRNGAVGGSQPHLTNGVHAHQNGGGIHASTSASSLNSRNSSPAPPAVPSVLPNFVKENFEGKSVMTTRCLECEMSTYRSETFTNIDVPIHQDEEDNELGGNELFLKQIMMSETLRENNKYWCEECSRLNEARRSVQFELLPKVMVLQLKRFTTTGSKCYMSKINDHIPTPFFMDCFCKECMPTAGGHHSHKEATAAAASANKRKHRYRLFAVIMHLGATLASGHYIAYVRATDPSSWVDDHQMCQRGATTIERSKSKKGIMRYLRRNTEPKQGGKEVNGVVGAENGGGPGAFPPCRSVNCCGIRGGAVTSASSSTTSLPPVGNGDYGSQSQRSIDSTDSCDAGLTVAQLEKASQNDRWLECDDETITVLTKKDFEDILGKKKSVSTTPYLLFYQRI